MLEGIKKALGLDEEGKERRKKTRERVREEERLERAERVREEARMSKKAAGK